jgi:hypothetical protein
MKLWEPLALAAVLAAGSMLGGGCSITSKSVHDGLQSDDPAVRQQAAIDAANRKDRQAVPLLVDRLSDSDDSVRFAAINALVRITGTDRGYRFYQPLGERAAAVGRWRQWLESAYPRPAATGPASGAGKEPASAPGAATSRAKAGAGQGGAVGAPAGGQR